MNGRRVGVVVGAGALLAAGVFTATQVGGDGGERDDRPKPSDTTEAESPVTTTAGASPTLVPVTEVKVRAEKIASLDRPVALTTRPGDDTLYVAEQAGRVMAVEPGEAPVEVLDFSDDVHQPESEFDEQGLLGLAFAPSGAFLYADYTNRDGDTRIVEWAMSGDRPDPGSRRGVLAFDQPYANHNGGALAFGPDGFLYISTGDGGSGGDSRDNGQSLSTLLGKILRIEPRPSGDQPYSVPMGPSGNPFATIQPLLVGGNPLPEIWAYGLRNPWRISFDRLTGDLWIGDVGQSTREEIDFQPGTSDGGENYGWNRMEGTEPFEGEPPERHVLPIHEYPTSDGCAVVGGYVYRGEQIPALQGVYVFSDTCNGELMGLRHDGARVTEVAAFGAQVNLIASFGEDQNGELYALSLSEGLFRLAPA